MKPCKPRTLQFTLLCAAWIVPAAAAPLSAPSTLPGLNTAVEIEMAPPVALPMPVPKPRRNAPVYPPADTGMAPAMGAPVHLPAEKSSPQRTPHPVSPDSTPLPTALREHVASNKPFRSNRQSTLAKLDGVAASDSPNGDTAKLNAAFNARMQHADLDETDRVALGIDASQFSARAPAVAARMQTAPMAGTRRIMGAPGSSTFNVTDSHKAKTGHPFNTEPWCKVHQGNQPRISRILPARDDQLAPDQLFAVKGVCFGDAPGTVEVRFNTSPVQIYKARVINWTRSLVHLHLPENISGVIPQNVEVVLTTQDNRVAPRRSIAFWPRWEKVYMDRYARVTGCWSDPGYPHTRSYCKGARDTVAKKTNPFDFPGRERGGLSGLNPFTTFGRGGAISATHYTEEDLAIQPVIGTDRWTFDLPPYAIYAGWSAEYESFEPARNSLHISVDQTTRELLVRWHMAEMGEKGFLGYNVDSIDVWLPVGVFRP
jgi:hypothetical protein